MVPRKRQRLITHPRVTNHCVGGRYVEVPEELTLLGLRVSVRGGGLSYVRDLTPWLTHAARDGRDSEP